MENDDLYPSGHESHKINAPEPKKDAAKVFHNIESDNDTLEPQNFGPDSGTINANDPSELEYWANELQISSGELKATIILVSNKVSDIRKYLSV
ncbi:DUF3606 domain-containing protein [Pedobacter psychrodurus]|uniref:DUF3606 domain-containing protein n=1 Tax=Pedobacter psychrodurus TaxID=2530456 RepID=A0A4R0Q5F3_9SPHI|nr:DUF3606 domain-containing protein [Pedobacter psychrodurus]TCD26552.1 DUF3606 domain-containing protein [Pedobacter psychrodurus]